MSFTPKKLHFVVYTLLLILGFMLAELFTMPELETFAQNGKIKKDLVGNFSRSLKIAQEENLVVTWDNQQKNIPLNQITDQYMRQYTGKKELRLNFDKLNKILKDLSPTIDKEAINAKLIYDYSNQKIKEFSLPQTGRHLNIEKTAAEIAANLAKAQLSSSLIIEETDPEISEHSLNNLGLNTLLARGESDFKGSSISRVHNIKIGAGKFNGLLIKPGEEFSFNHNLGPVDGFNGYRSELVIKNGKLIPEFGGGICQVSTTLFRAAALSGFPILERRPHSFPVKYYNPQGFDATIYPGVSDLRFKNDSPNHILIQNHMEGTKLVFEVFGSSDGRIVELDGPKILEQNTNGSMKTVLNRKIATADGSIKEDSFWSNYKSPASFPLDRNPLE